MKKPQSRPGRQNRLLVRPDQSIQSTNHRATFARSALQLMAALSVADGLVYGQCHSRKRFVDFRCFLETVLLVEARRRRVQTVALILDNGSTHAPKQLPSFVNELATRSKGKLTMQLYWLPVNASWLDQIEIWFRRLATQTLAAQAFYQLE